MLLLLVMYSNPGPRDEILFSSKYEYESEISRFEQDRWGTPCALPVLKEFVQDIRVPFLRLAHITHEREARQIVNETTKSCEFKVKQKLGRFSGRSFKWHNSQFVMIDSNTPLLEGYYSWWSPYAHDYKPPERYQNPHYLPPVEIRRNILEPLPAIVHVANYLKDPPESIYGNHVFHCDFKDLLTAYAKSRKNNILSLIDSHICIRFGGILRYQCETCHVLIICVYEDRLPFPTINARDSVFNTNGLTNDDGVVVDLDAVADFHPMDVITWAGKSFSYATAAIGFYYPNQYGLLKVEPTKWKRGLVGHQSGFCAKRVLKCPN